MDIFDQIKSSIDKLGENLKDQAGSLSESAKEKSMQMIDEWLRVIPRLQTYGMDISSFSVNLAISPGLDIEMFAAREDFQPAKVRRLLEENKEVKWLAFVLKTAVMAFEMNEKLERKEPYDKVILKIKVKVPPEVRVVLGEPILY